MFKKSIKEIKFEAVLRNVPIFQLVPIEAPPRCRYVSGTIAHELRVFCYEDTLHQSNGEYCFHCALKDHNLEMLWVINNLLSCMLNETCILLTSESTKIKSVWRRKKKKPWVWSNIQRTRAQKRVFIPSEMFCHVFVLFELFQKKTKWKSLMLWTF